MKKKILVTFGTRPEAIKMAPVIFELQQNSNFDTRLCVTGQHRDMLDQVLSLFGLSPEYDLDVMSQDQSLFDVTHKIMSSLNSILTEFKPDLVLVHGDTTTTMASSLAAYYHRISVGHVEAGLRTHNIYAPWPEEGNRQLVSKLASLNFAPTQRAAGNLKNEGVALNTIFTTGNTVIDALLWAKKQIESGSVNTRCLEKKFDFLDNEKKLILVTGHRREIFGEGLVRICKAIREIAKIHDNVQIVYPVHPNPNVKKTVDKELGKFQNIHLIEPLDYLPFVFLMMKSQIILTDSGGVQEEAPSLGKPVLVLRDTTERPEAVEAGTVKLVGSDISLIKKEVHKLLTSVDCYNQMSKAHNPYGDGYAARRIASHISCSFREN